MGRASRKYDKLNASKTSIKAIQILERGVPTVTNAHVQKTINISMDLLRAIKRLRRHMITASSHYIYLQGEGLRAAIYRYENFWLPMLREFDLRDDVPRVPPADIHYVWILHMCMPNTYIEDFTRVTSKDPSKVPHKLLTKPNSEKSQRMSRNEWNRKWKDEAFHDSSHSAYFDNKDKMSRIDASGIVKMAEFMKVFMYQVMTPQYKSKAFLKQGIVRYRQYLMAHTKSDDMAIIPAPDIYLAWMAHAIHPQCYKADMMKTFGEVFDHNSEVRRVQLNFNFESQKFQTLVAKSNETWAEMFARPLFRNGTMYRGREPMNYLRDINDFIPKGETFHRYELVVQKVTVLGDFVKGPYHIRIELYDNIRMTWRKLAKIKITHDGRKICERDVSRDKIKFSIEERTCLSDHRVLLEKSNAFGKMKKFFSGKSFYALSSFEELTKLRDDGGTMKKVFEDRGSTVEMVLSVTRDQDTCFKCAGFSQGEVFSNPLSESSLANEYGVSSNNRLYQPHGGWFHTTSSQRNLNNGTILRSEVFEVEGLSLSQYQLNSVTIHSYCPQGHLDEDGEEYGDNRMPVARIHTLNDYAFPKLSHLKCSSEKPGRFPSLDVDCGERAVVAKWVYGDIAFIIGHWQFPKGRKSGHLVVRIYEEDQSNPCCVMVPIEKLQKSPMMDTNTLAVHYGRVTMSSTPEKFLHKATIGCAVMMLYTLTRPLTMDMALGIRLEDTYSFETVFHLPDKPPLVQLKFLADLGQYCLSSKKKGNPNFTKQKIIFSVNGKRFKCLCPILPKDGDSSSSESSDSDIDVMKPREKSKGKLKKKKKKSKKDKMAAKAELSFESETALVESQPVPLYPVVPLPTVPEATAPEFQELPIDKISTPIVAPHRDNFGFVQPVQPMEPPPIEQPIAPCWQAPIEATADSAEKCGWDVSPNLEASPQPVSIPTNAPVAPAQVSQSIAPQTSEAPMSLEELTALLPDAPKTELPTVKKAKKTAIAVGVEVLPTHPFKVIPPSKHSPKTNVTDKSKDSTAATHSDTHEIASKRDTAEVLPKVNGDIKVKEIPQVQAAKPARKSLEVEASVESIPETKKEKPVDEAVTQIDEKKPSVESEPESVKETVIERNPRTQVEKIEPPATMKKQDKYSSQPEPKKEQKAVEKKPETKKEQSVKAIPAEETVIEKNPGTQGEKIEPPEPKKEQKAIEKEPETKKEPSVVENEPEEQKDEIVEEDKEEIRNEEPEPLPEEKEVPKTESYNEPEDFFEKTRGKKSKAQKKAEKASKKNKMDLFPEEDKVEEIPEEPEEIVPDNIQEDLNEVEEEIQEEKPVEDVPEPEPERTFTSAKAKPQKKLTAKERKKLKKNTSWNDPILEEIQEDEAPPDVEPEPEPEEAEVEEEPNDEPADSDAANSEKEDYSYMSAKERKKLLKDQKRNARRAGKDGPEGKEVKLSKQEKRALKNQRSKEATDKPGSGSEDEEEPQEDCDADAFKKTADDNDFTGGKKLSKSEKRKLKKMGKVNFESDEESNAGDAATDFMKAPAPDSEDDWTAGGPKKKGKKGKRK